MKILIAGDYCPCGRVAVSFDRRDYASVLSEWKELTSKVSYTIVNFECPVVIGDAIPAKKHGPNLRCTTTGVEALKYAGVNCVTLANNHFRDYGDSGVKDTLDVLEEKEVETVGGGKNLEEAARVLYKEIEGERLAIINCCENEFSIASDTIPGSNPLNLPCQYKAIREASINADYVLVIVHGGHEHFQFPSMRMVETYRFFIDAGADAVLNHHQHCYSGYEIYYGKPIFYGLGNFCFDSPFYRNGDWTEGFAVVLNFTPNKQTFELYPYQQCSDNPTVKMLPQDAFSAKLEKLNAIITNHDNLKDTVDNYYSSCAQQYSSIFEPFYNRLYKAARFHGLIPSFISKKRKLAATNYVCCEAHRDKLIWWLNHDK